MEINKNSFIIIQSVPDTKDSITGDKISIQECRDNCGKPGKVKKQFNGNGNAEKIATNFIKEGFNPEKIMINGEPSKDVLHLNKHKLLEIKRAKILLGSFGFQNLGKKFNKENVERINTTKELPEGYYLVYTPKINFSYNYIPTGTTPAHFNIKKAKPKTVEYWKKHDVKFTNKLPKDYEAIHIKDRTYIKEKNITEKDIKDGTVAARLWLGLGVGIMALLTGGILLQGKKNPFH